MDLRPADSRTPPQRKEELHARTSCLSHHWASHTSVHMDFCNQLKGSIFLEQYSIRVYEAGRISIEDELLNECEG